MGLDENVALIRRSGPPAEPRCCSKPSQHRPVSWQACSRSKFIQFLVLFLVSVVLTLCVSLIIRIYLNIKFGPRDDTTRRVVCYYRWQINSLAPSELPAGSLCTHIILGFATVGNDSRINLTDVGCIDGVKTFASEVRLINKKTIAVSGIVDPRGSNASQSVRVMLSVGGGGGDAHFANMVASDTSTSTFLKSCSEVVNAAALDGIDFDWEFPGFMDRGRFATLLRRTSEMLYSVRREQPSPLELSVALPGPFTLSIGFSVRDINRYCSFVNLMTYDLVLLNSLLKRTALHSALHAQPSWWYTAFSVDFVVSFWLMLGLTKPMINLGIPTYGVGYALSDKSQTDLFSPVKGYSHMGANLNYARICAIAKSRPLRARRDMASSAPYIDDGNGTWITYDDPASIAKKVEFALSSGFGGLMIFSLNADDYSGSCGQGRFPLTTAAVRSGWAVSTTGKAPNKTVS